MAHGHLAANNAELSILFSLSLTCSLIVSESLNIPGPGKTDLVKPSNMLEGNKQLTTFITYCICG